MHYRRHSPSKLKESAERSHAPTFTPRPQPKSREVKLAKSDFKEKLIVQGIISGIIMAVLLALSFADNQATAGIKTNLNAALSEHISAEQVATEMQRFLGDMPLSVPLMPEYTSQEIPSAEINLPDNPIPPPIINHDDNLIEIPISSPRIDEDLLREIFGETDSYYLQPTAPEPMTTPEL